MLGALLAFGLYQRENQQNELGYTVHLMISFLTGLLIMLIIFYVAPALTLGRGAFGLTVLFAFTGVLTARAVFLRLADRGAFRRRILVLGTGTRAAKVAELERTNGTSEKFHVVGYLPLNGTSKGVDPSMILHESGSLQSITQKYQIDEIVVGVRDRRCGDMPMNDLLARKMGGTSVVDLSTFFERETGCVRLESLNSSWLIFSDGFCIGIFSSLAKRAFDVVLASALLLLTLPVMVVTAALIWLESGLPIFYRQERVGAFGRRFKLLKFRSMRADAEADGTPRWATENDARCTRIGHIIRKLHIDELPQVINVLKGEMSFVGPRPERSFFVDDLAKNLKYYRYRHTVKPGITGWAQIRYQYGASMNDAKEKLQYDLYYIKNHSFFLDMVILAQTAHIVLLGKGAR
jgi:sugar transferase (PEP-CTERM system associated)